MRRILIIAVLSLVAGFMGYQAPYPVVSTVPMCRPYQAHEKCERGTYNLIVKSIEDENYGAVMATIRATCVKYIHVPQNAKYDMDASRYRIEDAEMYAKGIVEYLEVAELSVVQTTVCKVE